ncbi:MAG TPA: 4Fe-4S dicluster domain-containing protein, partial [Pirellulaceae bacterium]|nr:4Fe-4S dicluster domain-containing protein [Pirellulaceae bacterium]
YAVESKMSTTGAMADHQISLRLSKFSGFVGALERAIDAGAELDIESASTKREKVFAALVNDLLENKGKSVVVCGYRLPAEVQAQVCRINHKLGSYGSVLEVREVPDVESGLQQLSQLNGDIAGAKVDTLLVLGANPVYTAPADLKITETLSRVKNLVHFGLYFDETAAVSGMHGNLAHPLETWGDYLAVDGSWLISQPLIEPLFGAKSTIEILARLIHGVASPAGAGSESHSPNGGEGHNANSMFEVVKATAQAEFGGADFDKAWNQAVHDGFIVRQVPSQSVSAPTDFDVPEGDADWARDWEAGELELVFVPSSHVYDGRFANNGWMQELPDFLTKLTWDNAALVSPKTARVLGLQQGRMAVIDAGTAGSLSLPVNILPGMANGCVAVELGYGRLRAGRVGGDASRGIPSVGHDVGVLRTTKNWNTLTSVRATPTATKYKLATTQEHFRLDALGQSEINRRAWGETGDSALFREGNYANYLEWLSKHGDHGDHDHDGHADDGHGHGDHHGPERWPSSHHLHFKNVDITPRDYDLDVNHKWGMSIDLNKCIGCNACVIACQAENNIPIVGKESVARGRELHWMRIDRYFVASNDDVDVENLHVVQQPVTCMHCENAPCETVCPVAATVHSNEGLNDMVYNRCVGTRYCGNNCPYKVRRFNYLNYSGEQTFIRYPNENPMSEADRQLQNLVMNPEVTLRTRGVMEKCTYCVQRIQNGKILAKNQDRKLRPNEIEVACQQACPAQAIEFGDLHLKDSRVTKAHDNHRAYVLLEELNIYPRTKYLARVRNPHPALESLFKLG